MDDTKTLNAGPGGPSGDLWKTVLDQVQSDAAARRSKAAARSIVSADKRGAGEVDLLKRILVALESRREDAQLNQSLAQILAALQAVPRTDSAPQLAALQEQVRDLAQKLTDLSRRPAEKPDPAVLDGIKRLGTQLDAIPQALPKPADPAAKLNEIAQAIAAEAKRSQASQQAMIKQIVDHLAAIPKPADVSQQLSAIEAAVTAQSQAQSQAAAGHDALLKDLLKRIEAATQRAEDPATAGALRDLAQRLDGLPASLTATLVAALPQAPAAPDHSAQLKAILDAVRSMPTVDPDGLAGRIVEAIERIKPVDPTDLLQQLRADVAALPKPVDVAAATLDAVIAATRNAPTAEQIAQLRADIGALPRPVDATAKLDAIIAALSSRTDAALAEQVRQLSEQVSALPKPADLTETHAKLDAILAAMQAAPKADPDAVIQAVRAEIQAQPRPADPSAKLDELLAAVRKPVDDGRDEILLQILESVQKPQPVYHERFDQIIARLTAQAATPPAPAVPTQLLEQMTAALAKANSGPSIAEQVQGAVGEQLRSALAALPKPADVAPQLGSILATITALASRPAAPTIDVEGAVRAALGDALKGQAETMQSMRTEIAGLRDAVRHDMASQTAGLRDDLVIRSNEVITQVRAHAQTVRDDVTRSTSRLREEIQTASPATQAATAAANDNALKSVVAKLRSNPVLVRQEELLHRLAAASRANPAHQADLARRMLAELPRLAEWDAATTKAVEQLIESFGPDLMSGEPALSRPAAPAGTFSQTSQGYAWMAQPPKKNKAVPIALGIAAVIAVGVVLFLVINALSGPPAPANGSPKDSSRTALDQGKGDGSKADSGKTDAGKGVASVTPTPTTPTTPATPAPSGKDGDPSKEKPGPFELFPNKTAAKGTDTTTVAPPIVTELRNLTSAFDIPRARQIVFLVHAHTTSPTALAAVIGELKKTLAKVGPHQKFTIVFSEGKRFIEAPPHGLRDGDDKTKAAMESWIDTNIRPAERTTANPLVALDVALSYAPDLLWIVSDGLAGDGAGQVSSKEILDRLAALNPRGETKIGATQVGPADTAATLKAIAEKYGGAYVESTDSSSTLGKN